jgi:hypothetical protein
VGPAPDIESQAKQEHTATSEEFGDKRAGMRMGVLLFFSILMCLVSNIHIFIYKISHLDSTEAVDDDAYFQEGSTDAYLQDFLSGVNPMSVSFSVATVIAHVIAYGDCCAGKYKLRPHVKKWATGTLGMPSILFGVIMIGRAVEVTSRTGLGILCAIESVLLFSALVFSGLFIFGRRCGAPVTSG